MTNVDEKDRWIYVAVEDPGADEKFVGLHDTDANVSYIPAFDTKEDALSCLVNMPRRNNRKYEVQAVLFDVLCEDARNNGFLIFMTDASGKVIEKITP